MDSEFRLVSELVKIVISLLINQPALPSRYLYTVGIKKKFPYHTSSTVQVMLWELPWFEKKCCPLSDIVHNYS